MRRVRFWLLGATGFVVTFLLAGLFRKIIAVGLGGALVVQSGVYTADWLGDDPAMAVQSIERISPDKPNSLPQGIPLELDRATSIMAFKPTPEGHLGITERGLHELAVPVDGAQLRFTEKAIREINKANEDTDGSFLGSGYEEQGHSEYHFDSEDLEGGSIRLIKLKARIIKKLQQSPPDSTGARQDLGGALHTLQDFYSHSNWVELKKPNIDNRLGREIIPNPAEGFKPCPNSPSKLEGEGLKELTTGYFVPNTPSGKCRHGNLTIWDGISKDDEKSEYGKKYFLEARELATWATKVYIRQITEETPEIAGNAKALKALLGIEETCHGQLEKNQCSKPTLSGRSYGDPHLITFDGFRYSFQTVGEFIMTKSKDGQFEIQTRQAGVNKNLSMNTAVALKVGSDRVIFYAKDFPDADASHPVWVNGKAVVMQDAKLALPGGGKILKDGSNYYTIDFPTGEKVLLAPVSAGGNPYFNISPFVFKQAGLYEGLLGNADGQSNDELKIRDGQNLSANQSIYGDVKQLLSGTIGLRLPGQLDVAEKLYFDQVNKEFGNSWRVKQEESLFDYPSGKTTKDYTDKGFPEKYLKLDMLSSQQLEQARKECKSRNLDVELMEGCVFDVGFSGFSEFAYTTAQVNGYVDIVNKLIPGLNIPQVPRGEAVIDQLIQKVKPKICLPFVGCL
jgi:von Willebrand factor type D domain